MLKKIKQITAILVILFLTTSLIIWVLTIWDVMSNEIAKDVFEKIVYTFGAIYVVSLAVIAISKTTENKQ